MDQYDFKFIVGLRLESLLPAQMANMLTTTPMIFLGINENNKAFEYAHVYCY